MEKKGKKAHRKEASSLTEDQLLQAREYIEGSNGKHPYAYAAKKLGVPVNQLYTALRNTTTSTVHHAIDAISRNNMAYWQTNRDTIKSNETAVIGGNSAIVSIVSPNKRLKISEDTAVRTETSLVLTESHKSTTSLPPSVTTPQASRKRKMLDPERLDGLEGTAYKQLTQHMFRISKHPFSPTPRDDIFCKAPKPWTGFLWRSNKDLPVKTSDKGLSVEITKKTRLAPPPNNFVLSKSFGMHQAYSSQPYTNVDFCYYEVVLRVRQGHSAIGITVDESEQGCFLVTSGVIIGGTGRVVGSEDLDFRGLRIGESRFGGAFEDMECIGCGIDRESNQLYFTRVFNEKKVKYYIDNFEGIDKNVYPMIVMSGPFTTAYANVRANPNSPKSLLQRKRINTNTTTGAAIIPELTERDLPEDTNSDTTVHTTPVPVLAQPVVLSTAANLPDKEVADIFLSWSGSETNFGVVCANEDINLQDLRKLISVQGVVENGNSYAFSYKGVPLSVEQEAIFTVQRIVHDQRVKLFHKA